MPPSPTQAVLLLADISGYTQFIRLHAVSTSHAREITVRLLNALVRASRPPLRVAELEGDAVFFYALGRPAEIDDVANRVKAQVPALFRAFKRELEAVQKVPLCVCEACTTAGKLRLKQVVHAGEVTLEKIDRFEKLFGLDVVVVHRMLKNSVPAKEYLMLTDQAYQRFQDFYGEEPERRVEQLDGVGDLHTVVFYEPQLASVLQRVSAEETAKPPNRFDILRWKLGMGARTIGVLLKRT
jgi:hypothetical protein